MKIDIEKTFKKSVGENSDFHFYVDELADNDSMPTYLGRADEKYSFDEMNAEFFEFIQRKISSTGVFIRLISAGAEELERGLVFHMECASEVRDIETPLADVYDFADYGIKVRGDDVTFGAGLLECEVPHFAEFGSGELSLENPVNRLALEMMKEFVVCEV